MLTFETAPFFCTEKERERERERERKRERERGRIVFAKPLLFTNSKLRYKYR